IPKSEITHSASSPPSRSSPSRSPPSRSSPSLPHSDWQLSLTPSPISSHPSPVTHSSPSLPHSAQSAVHLIPLVLLLCAIILWFFSTPGSSTMFGDCTVQTILDDGEPNEEDGSCVTIMDD
ncbi:non-specific lipid transfer protein GPI-anchored 23-like, partial [Quercus robur]|uniref:non-specific lipid transfer protein GPI-anchored 23-like n=1 Tax=Quercus robur TaxID=38942 RepID=UPI0021620A26